jgi:hypothetical protein
VARGARERRVMTEQQDLFGTLRVPTNNTTNNNTTNNNKIIGMVVKLDRNIDRQQPCCDNLAVIGPPVGKHAASLRCLGCTKHRGWLAQAAVRFIEETVNRFGALATPIIVRQTEQTTMAFQLKPGRGSLWKNEDKRDEKDPGYTGSLNVEGLGEHWINAWVDTTKTGKKYFSIVIKPKKPKPDTSRPLKDEMSDEIPF